MRAAVIGGTGSAGRLVVEQLARRGDEVRVLSRTAPGAPVPGTTHHPVDLVAGTGLAAALDGVEVVLDLANGTRRPRELLVDGSRRAVRAGAAAGVGHHVLVSIVGCDRLPIAYYRAKTEQERVVADGPVPWTILRATQFHGLLDGLFRTVARAGVRPHVGVPLQPIDPGVVAAALADAAHAGPAGRLPDLGGPDRASVTDLADAWSSATGRGRVAVRIPLAGRVGRALRDGALCAPGHETDGPTFEEWLAAGGVR